jgi:hypothetical protein
MEARGGQGLSGGLEETETVAVVKVMQPSARVLEEQPLELLGKGILSCPRAKQGVDQASARGLAHDSTIDRKRDSTLGE